MRLKWFVVFLIFNLCLYSLFYVNSLYSVGSASHQLSNRQQLVGEVRLPSPDTHGSMSLDEAILQFRVMTENFSSFKL